MFAIKYIRVIFIAKGIALKYKSRILSNNAIVLNAKASAINGEACEQVENENDFTKRAYFFKNGSDFCEFQSECFT